VELWNEPNNLLDWDWRADPGFDLFCEMIGMAAYWVRKRGWKPVLGGPAPFDPYWLNLMGERGLLASHACRRVPRVSRHLGQRGGFLGRLGHAPGRDALDPERYKPDAEIWITETGYSTWRNDQIEQARRFVQALDAPADRLYWYAGQDLQASVASQEGLWFDPRHYHLGALTADGQPKLLARLLSDGGLPRVEAIAGLSSPGRRGSSRPLLITGGAGFIGTNLAESYLADGRDVHRARQLVAPWRRGEPRMAQRRHPKRVHPMIVDLRDERRCARRSRMRAR
jgi:CDP-paratose 2-epimerase